MRSLLPLFLTLAGCNATQIRPADEPSSGARDVASDSVPVIASGPVVVSADQPCSTGHRMPIYRPPVVPEIPTYRPGSPEPAIPCVDSSTGGSEGIQGRVSEMVEMVAIVNGKVLGPMSEAGEVLPPPEEIESVTIHMGAAALSQYKLQPGQGALVITTRAAERAP